MEKEENFKISINNISRWGMHRQIKGEQLIDLHLKEVNPPSNKQLAEIIKDWCLKNNIKNEKVLRDWQINNGYSEEQWNDYVTRKWRWTKWCLNEFSERIPTYYLERKSMLDRVSYSLIRVTEEDLANELFLRIKEKESSFEEIAKDYSKGPEKINFGLVGPSPLGKAHPELSRLLQVSKIGQIWPPKKFESWWVIVKLNSLESIPLDETLFTQLALELGSNYLETSITDYFSKL